jgi:hypothetical protein
MPEYCILYRSQSGAVRHIIDGVNDDDPALLFKTMDDAISFAQDSMFLRAVVYQIVALDEL